ncbi:phage major capsid protein [Listeria booriae]|uniref:phage major capsid protein n=1 Tax=Listeria booriae TaxID=1552123 RepID=UPI00162883CB|nr:phage major capsid protein [Listeria booriae]MBC2106143.1 phage major capsid protein [Listeria booriae]
MPVATMTNPDLVNMNLVQERAVIFNALKNGSEEEQEQALGNLFDSVQNTVMANATNAIEQAQAAQDDANVLVQRGTRKAITNKERKYFNAVIGNGGFENLEEVMPETIVEDTLSNLHRNHPLIQNIDVRDTAALAKYIFAKPTKATAFWGDICDDIREMIKNGFQIIDAVAQKLSGYIVVCKGMLELGPEWLATFVMECMLESLSFGLEMAIISGDGKQQPIGMTRALSGAVDGVYPEREKIAVSDLSPVEFGQIMARFAKNETLTGEMLFIVNPVTYWLKIFPTFAVRDSNGNWVLDRLPIGAKIVQSYAADENIGVMGVGKNYFLGVSGKVRIDKYTETLAIEDMDLFIAKFFGYGQPKDPNAFEVLDLTGINPSAEIEPKAKAK